MSDVVFFAASNSNRIDMDERTVLKPLLAVETRFLQRRAFNWTCSEQALVLQI